MRLKTFFRKLILAIKQRFASTQKPFVYVALGDSLTEGIGASHPSKSFPALVHSALKKELKFVEYHNFGKKYSKASHVLVQQLPKAIELTPDLITISVGSNDAMLKIGTKKFEQDFKTILQKLQSQTKAIIVVNNVPDFSLSTVRVPEIIKKLGNLKAAKINKIIEEETIQSGAILVDVNSQSKFLHEHKGLISKDRIHPSDLGYAVWGNAIMSQVRPAILQKYQQK